MNNIDNKLRLLIFGSISLFIIIPLLAFVVSIAPKETIAVNNYNILAKELPSEQRDMINRSLYQVVSLNLVENEKMISSPAEIRNNSVTSTYSESRDVHSGTFIIDLKKTRQSYFATYDWSENKDNPNISGYLSGVKCLSDDEDKIYKDFKCKDGSEETELPLEYQLPHIDINGPFEISYMFEQDGHSVISISNATPNGRKGALQWLRSKNIDPTDVVIYYLDINDRLGEFRYGTE